MTVVGWTDCYSGKYPVVNFTQDRRKALVERIRKRKYEFNHTDHCFLPYCCPVYQDKVVCELNKLQWDSVMEEAYINQRRGSRLLPIDVIQQSPFDNVIFEKEKYLIEWSTNNG